MPFNIRNEAHVPFLFVENLYFHFDILFTSLHKNPYFCQKDLIPFLPSNSHKTQVRSSKSETN